MLDKNIHKLADFKINDEKIFIKIQRKCTV